MHNDSAIGEDLRRSGLGDRGAGTQQDGSRGGSGKIDPFNPSPLSSEDRVDSIVITLNPGSVDVDE